MSIGHGSGVIDKAWVDQLVEQITADAPLDTGYNVPLGGGIASDGTRVYMDKAIPRGYTQRDGTEVPAWRYLCVHEYVELQLMDAGIAYLPAHAAATATELAAVQDDGYNVDEYDAFWDKWLKVAAKHRLGDGTPPDIETRPYEES